jgi:putative ABC transport system permease protein
MKGSEISPMFWRILWRLLHASRGRLLLAFIAVASGAAVCAALLNLDLDAGDKLAREFRVLGANVIVAPQRSTDAVPLMDAAAMAQINALRVPEIVAAAPYLYIAAQAEPPAASNVAQTGPAAQAGNVAASNAAQQPDKASGVPVIVAGTWFDQIASMNSWWKIQGQWVSGRDDSTHCMAGSEVAKTLGLSPGSALILRYGGREASLIVSGIATSGGSEDSQLFVSLEVAQSLAALGERIGLVQLSVRGSAPAIENVMKQLAQALPGLSVLPVRQLAATEGRLLERIRGLLLATVFLILLLTALGVLAAMAGLALERRRDVGLMKALGGSVQRVIGFFLAEAMVVGLAGGVLGCGAGMLLSQWMGARIFATSIAPRLIVLPVILILMVAVSLAGALPLGLLGRVRPAEILRGE